MRDGRHVGDAGDFVTAAIECAHSGLTARARAFDVDVKVFQTVFQSSLTCAFCCHLGGERSALTRATETRAPGSSPGQRVALTVSDGNDGVVERRVDVGDPINHCLFDFFTRTSSWLSHDLIPVDSRAQLLADRLTRTLAGTGVGLGTLTTNRQAATVTQAAIATQVHQTLDVHVDFAAKVTFSGELCNFATQLFDLLVGQILDLCRRVDPGGGANGLRRGATNTVDVGQRDNSMLVIWNVDSCNTGQEKGARY